MLSPETTAILNSISPRDLFDYLRKRFLLLMEVSDGGPVKYFIGKNDVINIERNRRSALFKFRKLAEENQKNRIITVGK